MQKVRNNLLVFFLLANLAAGAQDAEIIKNYIDTYKDLAMQEMQRTGVPASITLAQGILESGAGAGELVVQSNNHFGIKCKSGWTGETVKHDDDFKNECFRKYPAAADSYKDHSDFLRNNQRYAFLFILDPADYEGWARGLKKAGYATETNYPQALIKLIEDYHLQDYSLIVLGKMPGREIKTEGRSAPGKHEPSPEWVAEIVDPVPADVKPEKKPVYPAGEFRINETRAIFARKGTSFLAIAQQYHIDFSRIFEFNEISPAEETDSDQLVYLQRKRKTGNSSFHTVLPGETLHDIAQLEGIRLESLLELNGLNEDMQPAAGEKLSLKGKSGTLPRLAAKESYPGNPAILNKNTN